MKDVSLHLGWRCASCNEPVAGPYIECAKCGFKPQRQNYDKRNKYDRKENGNGNGNQEPETKRPT